MGGFFGVASKENCAMDLFFGIDYHSHLGTSRGGMAVYNENGIKRSIHNIENSPFRTKFEQDIDKMHGNLGIGCISDDEPQPLVIHSHLGEFVITTVGKINNIDEIVNDLLTNAGIHFSEMSKGKINQTELVAVLINQCRSIPEGIKYVQETVDGSMTLLVMIKDGIYAARDKNGRTPLVIGKKDNAYCISFECFAYLNIGYTGYIELGPAEIVYVTPESVERISDPQEKMKICSFLWIYYGYPTSSYEGKNVEEVRYRCGEKIAQRDNVSADIVAGVPDSGIAHAIGYANKSGIPYARPFIKYTPTWPRSFMPQEQSMRNLIAKMKIIPVDTLIRGKRLLLIDDSIVRGTQLRETTEFLYQCGTKEVHIRPACPPLVFGCKFLNFSRSSSFLDLITRRVIEEREGDNVSLEILYDYTDTESENYREMINEICKKLNFTSLRYNRLDDMVEAIDVDQCKLCTYCWNGKG